MPIIASSSGAGHQELIPEGLHIARCYAMVQIGTIDDEYKGQKRKSNKVRISWELPNEMRVFDQSKGEQPMSIHKEFTNSLGELASLRAFLNSWRGKALTEDECKGFDLEKLLSAPCSLNVIHEVSKNSGKKYAVIASISPMMKGLVCPPQCNDTFTFTPNEFDQKKFEMLPEWLRDRVKTSYEFRAMVEAESDTTPTSVATSTTIADQNDDLPF